LESIRTKLDSGTSWSGKLPSDLEEIGSSPRGFSSDVPSTEPVAPHVVETITQDSARDAARAFRGE
jgi:hypothetical protein